jgi:hypothetical protein
VYVGCAHALHVGRAVDARFRDDQTVLRNARQEIDGVLRRRLEGAQVRLLLMPISALLSCRAAVQLFPSWLSTSTPMQFVGARFHLGHQAMVERRDDQQDAVGTPMARAS